jgi:Holliday junction resolvase-like predicted endonuclease
MKDLGHMTRDQIDTHLQALGYSCIREHCPWGRCDVYMNHQNGVIAFLEHGQLRSGHEQYLHLRDCWEPQTDCDVSWKINEMRQWFGMGV